MSFNYPQAQNALSLQGNTVASTTPTAGQVLVWNGSQWQPGAGASGLIIMLFIPVITTGV